MKREGKRVLFVKKKPAGESILRHVARRDCPRLLTKHNRTKAVQARREALTYAWKVALMVMCRREEQRAILSSCPPVWLKVEMPRKVVFA